MILQNIDNNFRADGLNALGGGTWVSTHPGCVLEYLSGTG